MKDQPFQRILVVNVNWLGDVIFSSPVFKTLKKNYPQARITCLTVPRVKGILECVPGIDEILVYDEKGKDRGLVGKLRVIGELKKRGFDAAFLLHGSWSRALLVFLAGVPVRVGYLKRNRINLLTHFAQKLGDEPHKSDHYLNVLTAYGLKIDDRSCELSVPVQAQNEIKEILQKEGIADNELFIVAHTSGNWDLKRWPQNKWTELIQKITYELKVKVVISEGPEEITRARQIAFSSGADSIVLAGKTNLQQLAALLQRASLVISADSGPLHIASAVGKKVIGIYGPTMPQSTGPRGKAQARIFHKDVGCNRASCYFLNCPENVCMKAVGVEEVLAAVKQMLGAGR